MPRWPSSGRRTDSGLERFYFIGGSQGGHEALDAAARYPQDYDGVVAHYPAYNVTLLHLGSLNVGRALYADGGAGWINPQKTKLIGDAVYAKCDALDGAKDGIISNVAGVQSRIRRVDAALRRTEPTRATPVFRTRRSRRSERSLPLQTGLHHRRHGYLPEMGAPRRRALPGTVELRAGARSRRIRSQARKRCSTRPAIRR